MASGWRFSMPGESDRMRIVVSVSWEVQRLPFSIDSLSSVCICWRDVYF